MQRVLIAVLFVFMGTAANSLADIEILVLGGNTSQAEFSVLETFDNVGGENVVYTQTKDRSLSDLGNPDILWIGQGEICEGSYFLDADTENKIKNFVESGGIVISIGQDSDTGRPCEVGWITAPVVGIERGGVETFEVTDAPEVDDLFTSPNEVTGSHFDDAWTQPDDEYIMLASIAGGVDVGIALLNHGSGWYILTSLENESASDVAVNTPIMENLIHYAVNLSQSIAVEYREKLAVSWGEIKSDY
jgi:hypothetical protein